MIFPLVQDFADALAAMPREHPRYRILKLLDEAIRRDLHFIDRHPTTFFQCMWNTCWWYDCPQVTDHEHRSLGDLAQFLASKAWRGILRRIRRARNSQRPPTLFELLENWWAHKETHTPGTRWMRSLRPPAVALDSPLNIVIRGDTHGQAVFSADGRELAVVAEHVRSAQTVEVGIDVFDSYSGRRLRSFAGRFTPLGKAADPRDWPLECASLFHVVASPDGRYTALTSGNAVEVYDRAMGGLARRLDCHTTTVERVTWSTDSRRIAIAGRYKTLRVFLWPEGTEAYCLEGMEVHCITFSADGKYFAIGRYPEEQEIAKMRILANDNSGLVPAVVELRRAANGQLIHRFAVAGMGVHGTIGCLAFSPDGRYLASGGNWRRHGVFVWEVRTGRQTHCFLGHSAAVNSVAFSPDGSRLLTAGDDIRVWDLQRQRRVGRLAGHEGDIDLLDVSPDGSRVISAGAETWVGAWSGETGLLLARLHFVSRKASEAKFSADGEWFAALSYHGRATAAWHSRSLWRKLLPQVDLERFLFDAPKRLNRYGVACNDVESALLSDSGLPMGWISATKHLRSDSLGRVWAGSAGHYVGIFRLEGEL